MSLPIRHEVDALVRLRPVVAWFAHPFVPGPDCGLVYPVLSSRARACRRNHQVPRVPLPELGVTLLRETCTPPPGTLLPVPSSYGLIRQSPVALPYFGISRSEEHTSELQSLTNLVCRLLLEKKNLKKLISKTTK